MDDEMQALNIAALIRKRLEGVIFSAEEEELRQWAEKDESNRRLFEDLNDPQYQIAAMRQYNSHDPSRAWERVLGRIDYPDARAGVAKTGIRRLMVRLSAVAACLVFGTLLYLTWGKYGGKTTITAEQTVATGRGERRLIL